VYRTVEKTLLKEFVANNKTLVRVLSVLLLFLQPLVLIFGPLPGYLVLMGDVYHWSFWLSASFLLLCSYLSAVAYDTIIHPKYFTWVRLLAGDKHFFRRYIIGQAMFAAPTIVFLLLGIVKLENSTFPVVPLTLIMLLHGLYYWWRAQQALSNTAQRHSHSSYYLSLRHLALSFFKPVIFHFITYAVVLSGFIMVFIIEHAPTQLAFTAVFDLLLLLLALAIARIHTTQLRQFRGFLWTISPQLFNRVKRQKNTLTMLLIIIPAIITALVFVTAL